MIEAWTVLLFFIGVWSPRWAQTPFDGVLGYLGFAAIAVWVLGVQTHAEEF